MQGPQHTSFRSLKQSQWLVSLHLHWFFLVLITKYCIVLSCILNNPVFFYRYRGICYQQPWTRNSCEWWASSGSSRIHRRGRTTTTCWCAKRDSGRLFHFYFFHVYLKWMVTWFCFVCSTVWQREDGQAGKICTKLEKSTSWSEVYAKEESVISRQISTWEKW